MATTPQSPTEPEANAPNLDQSAIPPQELSAPKPARRKPGPKPKVKPPEVAAAPETPSAVGAGAPDEAKPARRKPGPKPKVKPLEAEAAPVVPTTPAPRKPAKPRASSTRGTAATGKATRATSAGVNAAAVKRTSTPKATPVKASKRPGAVTIVGGIAAIGAAATAAFYALRGKVPSLPTIAAPTAPVPTPSEHAHQADGQDSSASFEAGIADEGTIPS